MPLLLATRTRWRSEPDKYLEILKLCEIFAFRVYRLEEYRSNAGQASLFRIGHELLKDKHDFRHTIQAIRSELSKWSSTKKFDKWIDEAKEEPDDWYHWHGLRYLLYEYEIFLSSQNGASPRVSWDQVQSRDLQNTIEHVLPQSINEQPYWQKRFKNKHEVYVHDLGNLTLTRHNSYYGNKPFPDKKGGSDLEGHCYAKSPLYVERELTRWGHWDASVIDERRLDLLEWIRGRWAVDLSVIGNSDGVSDAFEGELDEDTEVFLDRDDEV